MKFTFLIIILAILLVNPVFSKEFPQPDQIADEPIDGWWDDIVEICNGEYDLDPYFVAAIVLRESWFDEKAVNQGEKQSYESGEENWFGSYYGKGLLQMTGPWIAGVPKPNQEDWIYNMPKEAKYNSAPVMNNPLNGKQNLNRGCWYIVALTEHYDNDLYSIATAYNKGWQGVDSHSVNVKTNDYVKPLMNYYNKYKSSVPEEEKEEIVEVNQIEPIVNNPINNNLDQPTNNLIINNSNSSLNTTNNNSGVEFTFSDQPKQNTYYVIAIILTLLILIVLLFLIKLLRK